MKIFAYAAGMLGIILGLQAAEPVAIQEPTADEIIPSIRNRRDAVKKQNSFEGKLGRPQFDGKSPLRKLKIEKKSNS